MQQYLGLSTKDNYKNGCMQDIHWTDGSFGYFPSYTLGAMYAAQFMAAMKKEVNVAEQISQGNLEPIFAWLDKNIWKKASLLSTDELVRQATGDVLNPEFFKAHLENSYL
jgi:carboxypeptidase Taq